MTKYGRWRKQKRQRMKVTKSVWLTIEVATAILNNKVESIPITISTIITDSAGRVIWKVRNINSSITCKLANLRRSLKTRRQRRTRRNPGPFPVYCTARRIQYGTTVAKSIKFWTDETKSKFLFFWTHEDMTKLLLKLSCLSAVL